LIIALGIITSYTDIRYRRIYNWHLGIALGIGLLLCLLLLGLRIFHGNIFWLINIGIGIGIGYSFYYLQLWGAGDGKLFLTYCILLSPLAQRQHALFSRFPSIYVFINIFSVSLVGLLIFSFPQIIQRRADILGKICSPQTGKYLLQRLLMFTALSWMLWKPIEYLRLPGPAFFQFIAVILLYFIINTASKKIKNVVPPVFQGRIYLGIIAAGILLRAILLPQDFTLPTLLHYCKYVFVYLLLLHIFRIIFTLDKKNHTAQEKSDEQYIPFAPLMFAGIVTAQTPFVGYLIRFLHSLTA